MGFAYQFWPALLALPLALAPILLHLLFRRKSPIIPFSTLRFIKASLQHTAARRRIQRWILLLCRVALLALLIWAVAQPAKMMASGWFEARKRGVAAIVIDTSWSMMLRQQQATLLEKADWIVNELLRPTSQGTRAVSLQHARIAIFTSRPGGEPPRLETSAKILAEWRPLRPQVAPVPLEQRVAAAIDLLSKQDSDEKWLVILTDMQAREFAQPLARLEGDAEKIGGRLRTILFDLHPDEARSAGITEVRIEPQQPIPGIQSKALVEVAGRAGDAPPIDLKVTRLDGTALAQKGPMIARFDSTGRSQLRFGIDLPAERWLLVQGMLQREDEMPWDDRRGQLVEMPPRQTVTVLDNPAHPAATRFIRLALDAREGGNTAWPLSVKRAVQPTGQEQVMVATINDWGDGSQADQLRKFAAGGGSVVLFLQPGLEAAWPKLPAAAKAAWAAILPSTPMGSEPPATYRPAGFAAADPLLEGLTDPAFRMMDIVVERFVPFARPEDPAVRTILGIGAESPRQGARAYGLVFRRTLGVGQAYTVATVPDRRYTNLPTHVLFLPVMVRMCLRSASQSDLQNVEIGQPLVLGGARHAALGQAEIQTPGKAVERVNATSDAEGRRFVFDKTEEPGVYAWRRPGEAQPLALANVQLPAAESDLAYREPSSIVKAGPDTIIARSLQDLQASALRISEPEPRWTGAIVLVMLLLCAEALLGSVSNLWKPGGGWMARLLGR